jgi:hypothetical protein
MLLQIWKESISAATCFFLYTSVMFISKMCSTFLQYRRKAREIHLPGQATTSGETPAVRSLLAPPMQKL